MLGNWSSMLADTCQNGEVPPYKEKSLESGQCSPEPILSTPLLVSCVPRGTSPAAVDPSRPRSHKLGAPPHPFLTSLWVCCTDCSPVCARHLWVQFWMLFSLHARHPVLYCVQRGRLNGKGTWESQLHGINKPKLRGDFTSFKDYVCCCVEDDEELLFSPWRA